MDRSLWSQSTIYPQEASVLWRLSPRDIVMERHQALNGLVGEYPVYSQVQTPT